MAYGTRYQMLFNDDKDAPWFVDFRLTEYTGAIHQLLGGPRPVVINPDGDEDNIYEPYRGSKAQFQILIRAEDNEIFADTSKINDKTYFVVCGKMDGSYIWEGWLVSDERHRKLPQEGYYFTITAVDYLSLIKGKYFQEANGELLLTKKTLLECLQYCFAASLPDPANWAYRVSHIINYSGAEFDQGSPALNYVLNQVVAYTNVFLDSTGRAKKCDQALEIIMEALGMYAFYSNGQIHFRSPNALTPNSIRVNYRDRNGVVGVENTPLTEDINIKSFSAAGSFLLENSEDLSDDQGSKEVSVSFSYGDFISIVNNANFFGYNVATEQFTGWNKFLGTNITRVYRVGNGRSYNPYAMRMQGHANPQRNILGVGDVADKVEGYGIRNVPEGTILTITIKYRYYDYRKAFPNWPAEFYPSLTFRPSISNGSIANSWYDVNKSPGQDQIVFGYAGNWLPNAAIGVPSDRYWSESFVESTTATQSVTFTTTKTPLSGNFIIEIGGASGFSDTVRTGATGIVLPEYIDIVSVNVNIQAQINGNDVNGEIHYLTQSQDYSLIEDTLDVELGDAPSDTVAGALFKAKGSNTELTTQWLNTIDRKTYPLLHHLVRMRMALGRFPKTRFEGDIYSNTLTFDKLLVFKNGNDVYEPGKFMQLRDEYDVKACRHRIMAISLDGQYKNETEPPPVGTDDQYEFYYQTGGGD